MTASNDLVAGMARVIRYAEAAGEDGVDSEEVRKLAGVGGWGAREVLRKLVRWGNLRPAGRRRRSGRPFPYCGRPREVYLYVQG